MGKYSQGVKKAYSQYKQNSSRRGIYFELTIDEFKDYTSCTCYLCGTPPASRAFNPKYPKEPYYYNGLDRVDNTKGYIIGNVRACCITCNSVKGTKDLEKLMSHLIKMLGGLNEALKSIR